MTQGQAACPPQGLRLEEILETQVPERRLVGRVLSYWDHRRGERAMPHVEEIQGADLGADWDNCFVIDARPGFSVPAVVFMGASIQSLCGILFSGRLTAMLDFLDVAQRNLSLVQTRQAPVVIQDEFPFSQSERLLARAVLAPLSRREDDDPETGADPVTFVLGAANGKIALSPDVMPPPRGGPASYDGLPAL